MKKHSITPRHKIYGYTAPSLLVWVKAGSKEYEDAIKEAKERSGLSRFKNWIFS